MAFILAAMGILGGTMALYMSRQAMKGVKAAHGRLNALASYMVAQASERDLHRDTVTTPGTQEKLDAAGTISDTPETPATEA
jgi:hypothetical protein